MLCSQMCGNSFGKAFFSSMTATVHKSRSFRTLLDEFGVEELDWPTQSDDLNPIEQLWDELE